MSQSNLIYFVSATSQLEYFLSERTKCDDTNKLILRLERLMMSLPVDPVKRRTHEQLPEEDVKVCPHCAKSFNITRLDT